MFRYFQGGAPVPESVAVPVQNRSHVVRADIVVDEGVVPHGVLLAVGSALGGWSLHILDGYPRYVHNLYGKTRHVLLGPARIGAGAHQVAFQFTKDEGLGGPVQLRVDGLLVAAGVINRFTPAAFNGLGVGLTCGYEWGPAVGEEYVAPFTFNGRILPRRGGGDRTGRAEPVGRNCGDPGRAVGPAALTPSRTSAPGRDRTSWLRTRHGLPVR